MMHRKLEAASLQFTEECKLSSQNWLQPFCESGEGEWLTSLVIANGLALAGASSAITCLSQSIIIYLIMGCDFQHVNLKLWTDSGQLVTNSGHIVDR